MNGRTALITGASQGIGLAIAARFGDLGAQVLAPTHAELDLGDGAAVRRYAAGLAEPVDILVNNAGINPLGSADEVSDAEFDETLRVDLTAPLLLARALAPQMAARGYGRILNVSSIWSLVGKPRRFAYSVAKSGLNGLTRALAVEVAGSGVLVNAVAPGFVEHGAHAPEQLAGRAGGRRGADPAGPAGGTRPRSPSWRPSSARAATRSSPAR